MIFLDYLFPFFILIDADSLNNNNQFFDQNTIIKVFAEIGIVSERKYILNTIYPKMATSTVFLLSLYVTFIVGREVFS